MTTVAVCAMFKDEGPDLAEWVAYHRAVGVDHFFLYDNESTDGGTSNILNSRLKDYVTVVPVASRPAQQRAFKHFLDYYASDWDWAAFIDLDEFIHPIEADSIKELLPRYEAFSAVLLHWLTFGSNGHDKRPNGLVIENYTRRLPEEDSVNQHVKSLVRRGHLVGLLGNAHVFDTKGPMCNSRGEPTPRKPIQDSICHEVMCINHYYTKSREDWELKLRRGRPDVPELRADPEYALFNKYAQHSQVTDERITRFSDRVKSVLSGCCRVMGPDTERSNRAITAKGGEAMSHRTDWMAEIHVENPYNGFPAHQFSTDLQGWGFDSPIFEHVISTYHPSRMIEVGSWKGGSATRIADLMKQYRIPDPQLVCIDTWLGSVEHWLNRDDPSFFKSLNLQWGRPDLYNQFLANVIHAGHDDVIIPFPADASTAAKFFIRKDMHADAIYIDAGHEYQDVMADLVAYWRILRPGGVLIGDDYVLGWIGVVRAVHDFADRIGKTVDASFDHKFLIEKPVNTSGSLTSGSSDQDGGVRS